MRKWGNGGRSDVTQRDATLQIPIVFHRMIHLLGGGSQLGFTSIRPLNMQRILFKQRLHHPNKQD